MELETRLTDRSPPRSHHAPLSFTERLRLICSDGHYQTTTIIAAVRLEGAQAPCLFNGAMDGEMFLAWIKEGLAPTLQSGDVVIMDNLAIHKIPGVKEAIEVVGARLEYLPPYSPDFNPIENMWSVSGIRSLPVKGSISVID